MKRELLTLFWSMLPIVELRGAIPYGVQSGLPLGRVLALAIVGNFLPMIPLYLLLVRYWSFLDRLPATARFSAWVREHARKKSRIVEVYETLGLLIFIGIPLPGTGAWTGTVVAVLLGLGFRDMLIGVIGGIVAAAALVTGLTYGIKGVFAI